MHQLAELLRRQLHVSSSVQQEGPNDDGHKASRFSDDLSACLLLLHCNSLGSHVPTLGGYDMTNNKLRVINSEAPYVKPSHVNV